MTDVTDNSVEIAGKKIDPTDKFLIEWGYETWKRTIDRLGEGLQRLVALNTTLLGGSLVFLKDDITPPLFRWLAMAFFLVSLTVALYGSIPQSTFLNPEFPDKVAEYKGRVARLRRRCVEWSAAGMWVGLVVAVLGALLKLAS